MLEILKIEEFYDSIYLKPKRIYYKQNGKEKTWDILDTHDSVAILLYHETKKAFILVKQLRPAVYLNSNIPYTYELCAGLVDKNKSNLAIAKEEILEETGYDVDESSIERVTSFYTSVGFSGGKQELYYAKVCENDQKTNGGGIDEEDIEVVYLGVDEAKEFIFDETKAKTPGLMFAFYWFFENKFNI